MGNVQGPEKASSYTAKDFSRLLGMEGFSDTLLKNHFKLYEGYVSNTNAVREKLGGITLEAKPSIDYSEIKRRFGFEFSGMRLHEYYFGNLIKGGKALGKNSALAEKINAVYGSFDAWKKDFIGTGSMRGVGWAILYYDPQNHQLFNVWIDQHQVNNLPGCKPILVMDVWEHAFMIDYQLDRAKYIEAFMKNVDWQEAANRLGVE
ncbi:MAG: superoxide dismutase [Phycisphaerae bacterium]